MMRAWWGRARVESAIGREVALEDESNRPDAAARTAASIRKLTSAVQGVDARPKKEARPRVERPELLAPPSSPAEQEEEGAELVESGLDALAPDLLTESDDGLVSEPDLGSASEPDGLESEPDFSSMVPDGLVSEPDLGSASEPEGLASEPDGLVSEPDGIVSKPDVGSASEPESEGDAEEAFESIGFGDDEEESGESPVTSEPATQEVALPKPDMSIGDDDEEDVDPFADAGFDIGVEDDDDDTELPILDDENADEDEEYEDIF